MQIEIIKTEVESKGKYSVCTVTYKGPTGAVESKKLFSFGEAAEAYKKLKDASPGELFEIKSEKIFSEKEKKDFWYWTQATVSGRVDPSSPGAKQPSATASPRSTYETPEERAKKQVYIVRQSSITAALSLLTLQGAKDVDTDDVLDYARQFESFVFDTGLPEIEVK